MSDVMSAVIAVVIIFIVVVGISAWSKSRLMSQGKIIKRANDFMEYAEIFTVRPITNEEFATALRSLNLKEAGVKFSGNTGNVEFVPANKLNTFYVARLQCLEQNPERSVYRFEFLSWEVSHGSATYGDMMNILLTLVEKMFVSLDPQAQVSTVKIATKTKRSIL